MAENTNFMLAHIINPVSVGESSDLHIAQPVTFESMHLAKTYAKQCVDVELYSAQFAEDSAMVPEWIQKTADLERSILDTGSFKNKRKLPLIKDILDRLYQVSDAEYFMYTNVDIALMPHFYAAVAQLIRSGYDAMVINRRTIAKQPCDPGQIELMWAQVGEKHPGYDCFIFRRKVYPRYELGTACIGANWIGKVLLANVNANADNFKVFDDLHLTFHLGDDRSWKNNDFLDYDHHNQNQLLKILYKIMEERDLYTMPLLKEFYQSIHIHQSNTWKSWCRRWFNF